MSQIIERLTETDRALLRQSPRENIAGWPLVKNKRTASIAIIDLDRPLLIRAGTSCLYLAPDRINLMADSIFLN